jgi:hypothetical protein
MAWGQPEVTRLRRQADQSINYAVGINQPQTLQHVGLLKKLRLIFQGTITLTPGTGAIVRDFQGPWNIFSNLLIRVSGLDQLYQVSGWAAYLINLVSVGPPDFAPDASVPVVSNATTPADIFNYPLAGTAQPLLFFLDLPFTTPLLGFEDLGLWLIQNETVNMEVVPTFAALGGATRLNQPYDLTGNATATVTAALVQLWREFYGVPARQEDMPPLGYIHQWEEQYTAVTGSQVDIDHQRGGVLLRLLYQINDADSTGGAANIINGISNANVTGIEFKYDANDTPFDENVTELLARNRQMYGKDLPQGVFTHDLFSETRTLQDSYNTENYINIKTRFRFAKSLIAGSSIRIVRERLLPVVVNTAGV